MMSSATARVGDRIVPFTVFSSVVDRGNPFLKSFLPHRMQDQAGILDCGMITRRRLQNSKQLVDWALSNNDNAVEIGIGDMYLKLPLGNGAALILTHPGFEPQLADRRWAGIADQVSGRVWFHCSDSAEGCVEMIELLRRTRDEAVSMILDADVQIIPQCDGRAEGNAFEAFCSDDPATYLRNSVAQEILPDERIQSEITGDRHLLQSASAVLQAFRDPAAFVLDNASRLCQGPTAQYSRIRHDIAVHLVQAVNESPDHTWHFLRTLQWAALRSKGVSVNIFRNGEKKRIQLDTFLLSIRAAAIGAIDGMQYADTTALRQIERIEYAGKVLYKSRKT